MGRLARKTQRRFESLLAWLAAATLLALLVLGAVTAWVAITGSPPPGLGGGA